ncbi:MAG TPA: hypothetical protein EYN67_08565 [Flavobacteriales bacterium]|nr:hypothetical protein [Flavobacteriales bacterium]
MFKLFLGLFSKSTRDANKVKEFREAKNIMGLPEIEGIENLTDDRIIEIYHEVKSILVNIGTQRKELKLLSYQMQDSIIRDRLIDEINGCYQDQLENMRKQCLANGYEAAYIKGRIYSEGFTRVYRR